MAERGTRRNTTADDMMKDDERKDKIRGVKRSSQEGKVNCRRGKNVMRGGE
jgi:hypothetical protein